MTVELYPKAPLEGDTPGQKGRIIVGDGALSDDPSSVANGAAR